MIHRDVFINDGCSEVVRGLGVGYAYTQCLDDTYIPTSESEHLHSINEIVTYNVVVIILTALFITLLFIKEDD